MTLSRRDFLARCSLAVAGVSLSTLFGCDSAPGVTLAQDGANNPKPDTPRKPDSPLVQKKGTIIGAARGMQDGKQAFYLSVVNLDAPRLAAKLTPLTFLAHGVSPNPVKPQRAVLFEKQGKGCCEVDLKAGKVLTTIPTVDGRKFYGHGAYSLDGKLLYGTETEMDTYRGVIVVRDGETFKELGKFPTFGEAPHDCHMIDEGKTLVITNGGAALGSSGETAAPSVTFVDIKTEKLIERVTFPNDKLNAGHLAISAAKDLVVVSAPRDGVPNQATAQGGITLRPAGAGAESMSNPADVVAKMIGETLSVSIHEATGVVGATNPTGNIVTFWNLKERKLVKSVDMGRPLGITQTLDRKEFIISFCPDPSTAALQRFNAETLEPVPGSRFDEAYMSGSHIIAYDLA
ncbi:MAG: DUF1513 domain-containing protein [Planctomycetaceae bacterium]|nr:DUF1513 domain-containing protein [Planctomycetaceae bacterium]